MRKLAPIAALLLLTASFLRATRDHHTIYATGLVDLEGRRLIDMVEGNAAVDLRKWTANADPVWLAGTEVVATDLAKSFRAGLSPHLDQAVRVAGPVVHFGGGHQLSALFHAGNEHGIQVRACGIHGRGVAGWAGAEDDQAAVFGLTHV